MTNVSKVYLSLSRLCAGLGSAEPAGGRVVLHTLAERPTGGV